MNSETSSRLCCGATLEYKDNPIFDHVDLFDYGAYDDIEEMFDDLPERSWNGMSKGDLLEAIEDCLSPAIPEPKTWNAGPPGIGVVDYQLHRAREKGLIADLTLSQWKSIVTAFKFECVYCGFKDLQQYMCMDHLIPVSKGGGTTWRNVVPACRTCNSKKRAKDVVTWLSSIYVDEDVDDILSSISAIQAMLAKRFADEKPVTRMRRPISPERVFKFCFLYTLQKRIASLESEDK